MSTGRPYLIGVCEGLCWELSDGNLVNNGPEIRHRQALVVIPVGADRVLKVIRRHIDLNTPERTTALCKF